MAGLSSIQYLGQLNVQPFGYSVSPPMFYYWFFSARFHDLLWPLLTSHQIHAWIMRPPPVKALSFIQFLRDLHGYFFWCSLGVTKMCLLTQVTMPHITSRFTYTEPIFCSSVPDFVVPLPSLHPSRETSLRLTNASGHDSRA